MSNNEILITDLYQSSGFTDAGLLWLLEHTQVSHPICFEANVIDVLDITRASIDRNTSNQLVDKRRYEFNGAEFWIIKKTQINPVWILCFEAKDAVVAAYIRMKYVGTT